ncbi:MAG: decaprenylphospho-beta-D-erythro-pentofuranosid-2-ulose 2-reductase [Nocardioides sp.]
MIDGTGNAQRILLLGATSEIGLATVRLLCRTGEGAEVVLAGRPGEPRASAAAALEELGIAVRVVDFEATDRSSYHPAVEAAFSSGDVDIALIAFGVLGDQEQAWQDVEAAIALGEVNYVAAMAVGVLLAQRMREQGHGTLVVLASVAAERPRRSNFVYGSTKAGVDAFYTGLGEAVHDDAVDVLVVRPGFVRTKMTAGLAPAPLAQTPEQVGKAIVTAIRTRRRTVWAPARLRGVMTVLRHLPAAVFRRLPL